jgi:hypothetical protein
MNIAVTAACAETLASATRFPWQAAFECVCFRPWARAARLESGQHVANVQKIDTCQQHEYFVNSFSGSLLSDNRNPGSGDFNFFDWICDP